MQVFGDAAPCIGAHSAFFLKCGRCCTAGVPPGGRQRAGAPGYAMLCVHEWTESPYNDSTLADDQLIKLPLAPLEERHDRRFDKLLKVPGLAMSLQRCQVYVLLVEQEEVRLVV